MTCSKLKVIATSSLAPFRKSTVSPRKRPSRKWIIGPQLQPKLSADTDSLEKPTISSEVVGFLLSAKQQSYEQGQGRYSAKDRIAHCIAVHDQPAVLCAVVKPPMCDRTHIFDRLEHIVRPVAGLIIAGFLHFRTGACHFAIEPARRNRVPKDQLHHRFSNEQFAFAAADCTHHRICRHI